jgi:S1-C subfamily serine protease
MALVALLALTACQAALPGLTVNVERTPLTQVAQAQAGDADVLAAVDRALAEIYRQAHPSVVNISVKARVPTVRGPREFFRFELPGIPDEFTPPSPEQDAPETPFFARGQGSGFVWDKEGHIVTNYHVVNGAEEVTVTFFDETTVPAEVIGTDPDTDLAVLKVDVPADRLQPVTLGDSSTLEVGQHVIAIGNPFGLSGTMTTGIISALGRVLPQSPRSSAPGFSIPDVIQTDAAINPGNSGGPLLNGKGEVIGVNFQIESRSGANDGIGFAIPINTAKEVVPELIRSGRVEHAWLGIQGRTVTPDLAEALGLPVDQGAQVISVVRGSPADEAGLRGSDQQATMDGQSVPTGGDIIVEAAGQPIRKMEDLITIVMRHKVGDRLDLVIRRGNETQQVTVTLQARPAQVPSSDSSNNR